MNLEDKAKHIRTLIIKALAEAGSGHTGGSLDLVDIFTVLYFNHLRYDNKNPKWEDRDRVVLSIGHTAPVLYATLAAAGFLPEEELMTLRKFGSRLQGHPSLDSQLPGVETSAGSLGQGLSISNGMAFAAKFDKKEYRVYCVMGDGEIQEGSVYEAAMAAAYYKLDNVCAILDRNRLQIDGNTENVMALEPLADKWHAFGWNVIEIDGHNHFEIKDALVKAENCKGKPSIIIAHTIMGKGVPEIENNNKWHGKVPTKEQAVEWTK
ncbi:MAG: transketolase [Bacteroidales bacterium]|nr:transketolase [Bacteroidales bacterium]